MSIVYGGGINAKLYISSKYYRTISKESIKIIGIIDDEPVLRKQYAYGYKVLGRLSELNKIYDNYNFDKIVITSNNIQSEKRTFVKEFCRNNKVKLTESLFIERNIY